MTAEEEVEQELAKLEAELASLQAIRDRLESEAAALRMKKNARDDHAASAGRARAHR